ncbi:MAG: efflux RND transporter periplasmic adaptor subunit [Desulfobulbus oligotrophicus]|nr:efflux RND transporter periplasmic adaptor subunit [Desulfobulbus oligotrophicus]
MSKTTLRRRLVLTSVLLITACTAAVVYYLLHREQQPNYMTVPVARGSIETTVLASGTVESVNMVSVGAQVSGQLKSLKVDLGDTVRAGQLVAEIDSLPQQNTLRTKTAALTAIRAQKQAKQASLALAELNHRRQIQMLAGDASSREEAETAEANLKVLRAEINALDAQIEQAELAVDTAQLDLGYTKISSPLDGVVVGIVTKEGQTVNANQTAPTIIKVAELDRMTIKVEISEADIIRVKPGQKVFFTVLGEPDNRYPAVINAIEPAPESIAKETSASSSVSSTDTAIYYIGIINVPNPDGKLRISMTAQVNIILEEAKDVLFIPSAALGDRDAKGRHAVRVLPRPGVIRKQWVHIGLNNNANAEVREGLEEGQQVVIGDPEITAAAPVRMRRPMRML